MNAKTCSYCHETKPRPEFSKSTRAKDGLQNNCKACQKARRSRGSCSIEGCNLAHLARGFCTKHWNEWRASVTPEEFVRRRYQTLNEALDGRSRASDGGCLIWTGNVAGPEPYQYGVLTFGGKKLYAHRVAYEVAKGAIPEGMDVDHICHVRLCVNADHLRPASRKQNSENLAGSHANSHTGVRGVTYDANRGQYRARVKHHYREIHVGRYDTLNEAAEAVAAARRKLFTHSNMDN